MSKERGSLRDPWERKTCPSSMEELKAATRTTGAEQRLKDAESNFMKDTSSRKAGPANSEHKQRKERRHLKVTAHSHKAIRCYNLAEYILMQQIEDEKGKGGPCTQEGEGYSCLLRLRARPHRLPSPLHSGIVRVKAILQRQIEA